MQRVPKSGLCKQHDDLPIVGEDETKALIGCLLFADDDL